MSHSEGSNTVRQDNGFGAKVRSARDAAKRVIGIQEYHALKSPQPDVLFSPVEPVSHESKLHVVAAVSVGIVMLAVISGTWLWMAQRSTPNAVFTAAISKLLDAKTVTQKFSVSSLTGVVAFDASNPTHPLVSSTAMISNSGMTVTVNGYGSLKNDYIKYASLGSPTLDTMFPGMVGTWVQVRTNGKLAHGVDSQLVEFADPRDMAFGDFIIGNFSANDRRILLAYIAKHKVYTYDKNQVGATTMNGSEVYVYTVHENVAQVKALNKKAAAMLHIPVAQIKSILGLVGSASATQLYVDVNSHAIVKYTSVVDGQTIFGSYTNYNTTSLPKKPAGSITWKQFERKQSSSPNVLGPGSSSGANQPMQSA